MTARSVLAIALLSTLFLSGPVSANETDNLEYAPDNVAMIGFDSALHDFGDVSSGELLEHDFFFINNGTADLVIDKAFSRASGTSVLASHQPLETGEIGQIAVRFDTTGLEGEQFVRVRVESNAYNAPSTLYLKANVLVEAIEE